MAPCQVIPLLCNLEIYSLIHLGLCLKCNNPGCELENRQMVSLVKLRGKNLSGDEPQCWKNLAMIEGDWSVGYRGESGNRAILKRR